MELQGQLSAGAMDVSYDHSLLFQKISSYLHKRPTVPLWSLSRELGVSRRTIQKVVCIITNKTFSALREEILIAKVRQLLTSQPEWPIKQISFSVGYKSPRSFARAIRRSCGLSPEELRVHITQELLAVQTPPVSINHRI